jgi:predicted nucleotidyltransferase
MPSLTDTQLRQLTDAIVRACHPVRVILFGSQARGDVDEHSDIDFLIIQDEPFSPSRSRRREIGRLRRGLPSVGIPVDILMFDADEVERWGQTTNHVIARALREGTVVHERS